MSGVTHPLSLTLIYRAQVQVPLYYYKIKFNIPTGKPRNVYSVKYYILISYTV